MSVIQKPINLNTIFRRLKRKFPFDYEELDVVDWAGEAIDKMGIASVRPQERVIFLTVKDYQANLPSFIHQIVQIARDYGYDEEQKVVNATSTESDTCSCQQVNDVVVHSPDCHNDGVAIDKDGAPLEAYDVAYYRPFYDLHYLHKGWFNSNTYQVRYRPVKLSNHVFFNSIVCEENQQLMSGCAGDEYTIIDGDLLRFNFKEGRVAVSCLRHPTDARGWPKIEGGESATEAITWYCTMQICEYAFYDGQEGFQAKMNDARQQWQWYCQQAGSNAAMIQGIDEWENFTRQNIQLLPTIDKYSNFFGTLNRREKKLFNRTTEVIRGYHSYGR